MVGGVGGNKKERVPHAVTKTEASTNRFAKGRRRRRRRGRGRRRGEVAYASAIINQSIIEAAQALTPLKKTYICGYICILYSTHTLTERQIQTASERNVQLMTGHTKWPTHKPIKSEQTDIR